MLWVSAGKGLEQAFKEMELPYETRMLCANALEDS